MATIKGYTDLEQSKKLAEILPIESADMQWIIDGLGEPFPFPVDDRVNENEEPCWSLAALFNVIPKRIKDYNVLRIDISENDFALWYDELGQGVNDELPDITMKSAVDVCVEMILKLNELNLL